MQKIINIAFYCLLIFFFSLFFPLRGDANQTGQIQGQVFDFGQNRPLVNHSVVLEALQKDKVEKVGDLPDSKEIKTNEEGFYEFRNLPLSFSIYYTISTEFEGNTEQEEDIMVTNWIPSVTVDFNLNLNTFINDPQVIKILRHSVILRPLPDHAHGEAVQVLEILRIENSSQFGFQQEINGQLLACLLDLPAGAEQVQAGSASIEFTQDSMSEDPLRVPAPIPTGQTDLTVTYILHTDKVLDLSRTQPFLTEVFQLLIPESLPFFVQSQNLGTKSSQTIHNVVYSVYQTIDPIGIGRKIQIEMKNTPSSPTLQIVLVISLVIFLAGFAFTLVLRIRKPVQVESVPPVATEVVPDASWLNKSNTIDLEAIKKVRLEFIAHLDEMHQKREMSDRVHKRIRREQVERLSATLAQIQEQ
ncbi:hypothetical protein CMK18_09330 [Candidatus Poribacteria bacterium]|nr:hypothetical protein [Candidatus Poribacteria bacterium]